VHVLNLTHCAVFLFIQIPYPAKRCSLSAKPDNLFSLLKVNYLENQIQARVCEVVIPNFHFSPCNDEYPTEEHQFP
jgi:hypothetical protein